MKSNYMVCAIIVFGILVAITAPHLVNLALQDRNTTYETNSEEFTMSTEYNADLAVAIPISEEQVTIVEEEIQEEIQQTEEVTETQVEEVVTDPVVYDGLTMDELTAKLNRVLRSTLSGMGYYYAKYSLDYGVDPYIAVAISLHETGCNSSCSYAVNQYNNVGGLTSGGSLISYSTLEDGIAKYIYNLKKNYYDYGLTTLEQINTKYATSSSWSSKVNYYLNIVKAA